jgi:cell division septal protein FtsQ
MFFRSKSKIAKRTLASVEPEKEKVHFSRVLFYLLIFVFGAVLVYVLGFSSFLQIHKIAVRGLEELPYEKVMDNINSTLDQKYFGLLAKNNILLIRSMDLKGALMEDFKKISSVKIEKIFPDTIVVSVQERHALLVWCTGESCFLVDENGLAYSPADFNSPEVAENNLIIVRDASRSPVAFDRVVLKPEIADFLLAMRKELRDRLDLGLNREFETPKSISGDIVATTSEGWKIMLNKDLGAAEEAEMLQIVLDQNIGKEKRADLEYVDLRSIGKVYYKLKNTNLEESSEDAE